MVLTDEERKVQRQEYYQKNKERIKEKQRIRNNTPEGKEKQRAYNAKPESLKRRNDYGHRPESLKKQVIRNNTPEGKEKQRAYNAKPESLKRRTDYSKKPYVRLKVRKLSAELRLTVLQYYSKQLSNSNIPCCRCCGESEMEFLAIDHIAGKRQMDSETELIKLGYTSKLTGKGLSSWIIKNNFPEGFQILCHNCNFAKGKKGNNNTCPHEKT
jgi:hypothetical protein